jgi:MFS family permease
MRRLLVLVSAVVLVDSMLYAALTPLLPHFVHDLHLSKAGAGLLVGSYAAGALVGSLPGGIATARLGVRRAVLAGLAMMTAASLGFAFAHGFWPLFAARFLQGFGSGFTWAGAFAWLISAGPRDRRGELLGTALGAAVIGVLLGPVVGAAAALVGRGPIFTAVGALGVVLAVWTFRVPGVPTEAPRFEALRRGFRNGRFVSGLSLMLLPALLFAMLSVLGPLQLSAAGWGSTAIAAVWLLGAGLEAAQAPLLGRFVDRRGRLLPIRLALAAGALLTLALAWVDRPYPYAALILLASMAYGALFTPGMALIADGAEQVGLAQGLAFGMMNAGWAIGAVVGPSAGGAIATAAGDLVPYLLVAGICVAGLLVASAATDGEGAAVRVDRLARDAPD